MMKRSEKGYGPGENPSVWAPLLGRAGQRSGAGSLGHQCSVGLTRPGLGWGGGSCLGAVPVLPSLHAGGSAGGQLPMSTPGNRTGLRGCGLRPRGPALPSVPSTGEGWRAIHRWFCSGSYIKLPLTGWLINNRHFSLTVLEAGGLRSGCRPGQVLVRTLSVVCRRPPSPCGLTWQKGGELALWSLPITLVASSNPNHLPKALPPDTITLGLGFSI